jgi:hypothetical protein
MDLEKAIGFLLEQQAKHDAQIATNNQQIAANNQQMANNNQQIEKNNQLIGQILEIANKLEGIIAGLLEHARIVDRRLDALENG